MESGPTYDRRGADRKEAAPKTGLRDATQVGELYLADISVPPTVYHAMGVGPAPDFPSSGLVRLLGAEERRERHQP